MLIDPFTIAAQLVNFALLVWLLRRFLYGPVTRAMKAREARVREEVEEARRLRAEAEAEGERYRTLLATFEAEREARLGEMRAELDAIRQAQVREVRAEIKGLRERWTRTLEQEKEAFLQQLRMQVARGSVAVMRRALKELADDDLEDRLITRFVERVAAMKAEDRERLVAAVREEGQPVFVRTARPSSAAQRAVLTEALAKIFGHEFSPRFETNPDLVAGVELRAGGLKVGWTLDDYLDGIEETMREAFHETTVTSGAEGDA